MHQRRSSAEPRTGQSKQKLQGQSELDTRVGVLSLAPSLTRRQRCPSAECGRCKPEGEITATNQCSIVLRPVGDPILRLVFGMDLRTLRHGGLPNVEKNHVHDLGPDEGSVHQRPRDAEFDCAAWMREIHFALGRAKISSCTNALGDAKTENRFNRRSYSGYGRRGCWC